MTTRGITTLGIVQLFLVFGIFGMTRIAVRFSESVWGGRPVPWLTQFSDRFGLWLLLVPILWTLFAAFASRRQTLSWTSAIIISGTVIILGLCLILIPSLLVAVGCVQYHLHPN